MKRPSAEVILLLGGIVVPVIEVLLPPEMRISDQLVPIFIFCVLAYGLHICTGLCGLLNLGIAGFMAIGAYVFAILGSEVYPFQVGWLGATMGAMVGGLAAGLIVGIPTLRLRGDYLAIVTLAFGEIVQDLLRNLEVVTKGSQGINPLVRPGVFGFTIDGIGHIPWYYLMLLIVVLLFGAIRNVERSVTGRQFLALREDELAARCMGVPAVTVKLIAFSLSAAVAALAGALWASYLDSTGEPGNFDFQLSVLALCILIVGGLGSTRGVPLGAIVMVGMSSIVLAKLTALLATLGYSSTASIFSSPTNWKYFIFGAALILMMRLRPEGILPSELFRAQVRHAKEEP